MNKELRDALSLKCKDMGLTDKALDELAELGSEGLTEEASQEDIDAKADFLAPFAKAMQGEITRKTRKSQSKQSAKKEGSDSDKDDNGNAAPEWFKEQMKSFDERLQQLQAENDNLKAERAKQQRQAEIVAKANELGIPGYLVKRVSFSEDADIDKELKEYKQELVNNSLLPKGSAGERGYSEQAMKASAESWAKSLPDMD